MIKLGIFPQLTKSYILEKITQEQIFTHYLNVNVQTDYLIKTPNIIRFGDDSPSFGFKYSQNGKLRARDFAGYFWGDCFDIVGYILKINSSDKNYFNIILEHIAKEFNLHKYSDGTSIGSIIIKDNYIPPVKERSKIEFQARGWDKFVDEKYWKNGNINNALLNYFNVYPCEYIWVNHIPVYIYNPKDRAYAYQFDKDNIKIYFPDRQNFRFLGNSAVVQGINKLQNGTFGIITKSYKDVMSLRSFNILSVALPSETTVISFQDYNTLLEYSATWYSLLDFDFTGIRMANILKKRFNIEPLFLPQHKNLVKKTKNGECQGLYQGLSLANNFEYYENVKDFYDFVSNYGVKVVQDKIKKEIKQKLNKEITYV